MAGLVVGIYPNSDPKALENALGAQHVDLSRLKVVSSSAPDESDASALQFVDVIAELEHDSESDEMTHGRGIMSDSGGTGVPGIGGRKSTLGSFRSHTSAHRRYLAAFPIAPDEVDNFDEAVAARRAVVLYPDAGTDAPTIAAAFRAAGLLNVRSYR